DNAIVDIVLTQPVAEGLAAEYVQSHEILWIHTRPPFAARNLYSSLAQTVDGNIALRNLHHRIGVTVRIGIVRVAADEGGLSCQGELGVAFSESQLGFFTFLDVAGGLSDERSQEYPKTEAQRAKQQVALLVENDALQRTRQQNYRHVDK